MRSPVFIGDEVSAAGFALAGAQVRVSDGAGAGEALREAMSDAPLVLIGARVAGAIPETELHTALRSCTPLVLVVPDPIGGAPAPDLGGELRRRLGMEG
jgi:vacuolar-type H+-ATPase subunit F/Vma7